VFDEERYFATGTEPCVLAIGGVRVGLAICEDIWLPGTVEATRAAGAELLRVGHRDALGAEDLAQLRLDVAVDEADVGHVQVGQKATFTVSAFPARRYPASIHRVAYGSTKTDNVVTYSTTLNVDNADLSLRPGMTAAAAIVAREARGVLVVPNTALRFSPASAGAAPRPGGGILSQMLPRPPSAGRPKTAGTERRGGGPRQIWVLQDGQPVAVQVKTGISDGRLTEVSGDGLQEGMAVITEQRSGAGS